MTDMSLVIIPKSDQLNSDDLIGGPRTVTITGVTVRPGTEQPVAISFDGDGGKPYKPCKSMSRVLVSMWGPDAKQYAGRSLTLYRDPKVKWAGLEVGGIRISHMSHIEREHVMALTESKQSRKPFIVKPLAPAAQNAQPPHAPSAQPADKAAAPTGIAAAGQPQAEKARERFLKAVEKCQDLAATNDLDEKLGDNAEMLGDFYLECSQALQAKIDALKATPEEKDERQQELV